MFRSLIWLGPSFVTVTNQPASAPGDTTLGSRSKSTRHVGFAAETVPVPMSMEARAADAMHIRLAREACRHAVAEYVKKWLMKEDKWRQDQFSAIIVVFPDEKQFGSDAELEQFNYEPTIKL